MLFQSVISDLAKNNAVYLGGLWGSSPFYLIAHLYQSSKKNILVVVEDDDAAGFALDDLSVFLGIAGRPAPDLLLAPDTESDAGPNAVQDKIIFLNRLITRGHKIAVASQSVLLSAFPDRRQMEDSVIQIKVGQTTDRLEFIERLLKGGYEKTLDAAGSAGEISIRGGITDIFAFGTAAPMRLEWDGNRIESIRLFDIQTQLSAKTLESAELFLVKGLFHQESRKTAPLLDYFPPDTIIVFIDHQAGNEEEIPRILKYHRLYLDKLPVQSEADPPDRASGADPLGYGAHRAGVNFNIESLQRFSGGFTNIVKDLQILADESRIIHIIAQNKAEESHFRELLASNNFSPLSKLRFSQGRLNEGFWFKDAGEAFISHRELFNRYKLLRQPRAALPSKARTTEAFWELQRGDFAVHTAHGIGRYLGLRQIYSSEFLVLEYLPASAPTPLFRPARTPLQSDGAVGGQAGQESPLVYVPITQIGLVSKYWAGERRAIKMDKIGATNWLSRMERVEKAVQKLAKELLYIQALRMKRPGFAYPPDTDWQREFESSFPYEETSDQTSITGALKGDMESARPMDRLICGDVGYGKTELAVRAAFKVCMAGKQAAIIAPTTILAQQHFRTFSERMADYPINIEVISRFRSDSEQRDIAKRVSEGKIDILIGTHRLIQGDIRFKDLGLVVIDEEQRFGVEHKEYFKKIKASVDVLTLSATPIPRTLHLSLSGLREISTMTTPPRDRQSIRTIVCRFDNQAIKEAVHRELQRKGQIYFVHNRIYDIERVADRIRSIYPEAKDRIVIAHGQMPGSELEQKMRDFVDGKYDILVSTNIIESGLDIPRVNTIFINNADDFGLSDLHQLRGRVGRYKHQAYAYFIVPEDSIVGSDAAKRLKAIEEFNELGAGFKIAMRDMEIRGIGNILGKEQHGYIAAVGYELYCKLIEQTVKQLKGKKAISVPVIARTPNLLRGAKQSQNVGLPRPDGSHRDTACLAITFPDGSPLGHSVSQMPVELDPKTEAYIPSDYISSETERLNIYRRLSLAESGKELAAIERELKDRFGRPLPNPARNLLGFMCQRMHPDRKT